MEKITYIINGGIRYLTTDEEVKYAEHNVSCLECLVLLSIHH